MKDFWEKRYNEKELAYGLQPNSFFKKHIDKIRPGKLLLPLEGEGRNALYAASIGWDVTAFDFSVNAQLKALQLAEENQLQLTYKVTDALSFTSDIKYDVIALIYTHLKPEIRIPFHTKISNYLNPKGILISQHFHPNQLKDNYPSGGPQNEEMLYTVQLLQSDFNQLKTIETAEKEILLNEGKYHQGKAFVTNFVGQL